MLKEVMSKIGLKVLYAFSIYNRFMEKSVVREIDQMRSSLQQQNSSFTTTFNGGSFDLRRYIVRYTDQKSVICLAIRKQTCLLNYLL